MIVQENMHYAKTHFSELVKRTLAGDEVVIAKSGEPLVKLIPFYGESKQRRPGSAKGAFSMDSNFNDDLDAEELREWGL